MKRTINLKSAFILISLSCVLLSANFNAFAITSSSSSNITQSSAEKAYKKAYRFEHGKNVKKNISQAIKWYKKAANISHAKAQYRLGILYYKQKNYKKAKYWLEKRAKAGEPDAQYHYANILRFGLHGKSKTTSARKWYRKAAKQGHKQAQYELAVMYQKGIGAKKNIAKARTWYKKAAKQNHKQAKQALKKLPGAKNKKTAQQKFLAENTKQAKAGDSMAQYRLGNAYRTGKKAPKNLKKAVHWIKKAAKANHAEAQYLLATMYFEGNKILRKDTDKARHWYSKAADNEHKKANKKLDRLASQKREKQQLKRFDDMIGSALLGEPEQQYELGMRYLLGFKTAADDQQAIYWLKLAAEQKHPLAMYHLANQYMKGNFVEKDAEKAIHYFAAAAKHDVPAAKTAIALFSENGYELRVNAESGNPDAQFAMAQLAFDKNDAEENINGLHWLKMAVDQSFTPAILAMAKIYEKGDIVPKSLEKAFQSYLAAAELNDANAQYQLGRMYQAGIGTKLNQQLAFRWFEKAASQGLAEAQQALQFSGL